MDFQLYSINLWAVLVCFISNMIIGALWYSPMLFGNAWLALLGKKAEDISKEDGTKSMMISMIPTVLKILVLAIMLSLFNATTIADALIMGTLISVGFIGMNDLNLVFFEGKPFKLIILNVGYSFVSLNIAAVVLTLWK